jgi:hypothetical protein
MYIDPDTNEHRLVTGRFDGSVSLWALHTTPYPSGTHRLLRAAHKLG